MGVFDTIKAGIRNQFDKRKADRELMEKLQKEAEMQRRQAFEDQFRIDAKEVALAHAKKESAKRSGLQKLRAINRTRNLNRTDNENPGGFFEKLADYTRRNVARREENLKRTEMMRGEASKMREERLQSNKMGRDERIISKPFSNRRIN